MVDFNGTVFTSYDKVLKAFWKTAALITVIEAVLPSGSFSHKTMASSLVASTAPIDPFLNPKKTRGQFLEVRFSLMQMQVTGVLNFY